jgi:hypothetical protein
MSSNASHLWWSILARAYGENRRQTGGFHIAGVQQTGCGLGVGGVNEGRDIWELSLFKQTLRQHAFNAPILRSAE